MIVKNGHAIKHSDNGANVQFTAVRLDARSTGMRGTRGTRGTREDGLWSQDGLFLIFAWYGSMSIRQQRRLSAHSSFVVSSCCWPETVSKPSISFMLKFDHLPSSWCMITVVVSCCRASSQNDVLESCRTNMQSDSVAITSSIRGSTLLSRGV